MNIHEKIEIALREQQDLIYQVFQRRLMPTVDPERVIGVRTPELRTLAKELYKDPEIRDFLEALPHQYYEENNLHSFLLAQIPDYEECLKMLNRFLPYLDNWATCDCLRPVCFKKNRDRLPAEIEKWMASAHPYTIRFGIEMLMVYFLDEAFDPDYPAAVAVIQSDEYYVNMMIAWYFATALAKQYDAVIRYLEEKRLSVWVHNKTIQKAIESYRIPQERKNYLRSLKIGEKSRSPKVEPLIFGQ